MIVCLLVAEWGMLGLGILTLVMTILEVAQVFR